MLALQRAIRVEKETIKLLDEIETDFYLEECINNANEIFTRQPEESCTIQDSLLKMRVYHLNSR